MGACTPNPAELICNEPPSDGEGQLSVDSHGTIFSSIHIIATRSDSYVGIYIAHTQDGFHVAQLSHQYSLPEGDRGGLQLCMQCSWAQNASVRIVTPIPYN